MAPASSSWIREEISGRRIPELVQLAGVGNPGEGARDVCGTGAAVVEAMTGEFARMQPSVRRRIPPAKRVARTEGILCPIRMPRSLGMIAGGSRQFLQTAPPGKGEKCGARSAEPGVTCEVPPL